MGSTAKTASRYAVNRIDGLVYSTVADRDLLADVYLPHGAPGKLPVILWLHGGGWRLGDRRMGPDLSRFFAERGFAMVSIDYRLSGDVIFPAQAIDVKTAIRWVRSVAGQFSFDENRIGLWGSSSGGHLAACAALAAPDVFASVEYPNLSNAVQAVVDGYGPTDFSQMDAARPAPVQHDSDRESAAVQKAINTGAADSFESLLIGAPVSNAHEAVQRANPVTYVHTGAPPFLILHGQSDVLVPWQQSQLLFNALEASGNDATLLLLEKLGHGFLNKSELDSMDHGRITRYATRPDDSGSAAQSSSFGFDTIETFFRKHLAV